MSQCAGLNAKKRFKKEFRKSYMNLLKRIGLSGKKYDSYWVYRDLETREWVDSNGFRQKI